MTDSPSTAPDEPNGDDETRRLVNSIWRAGWTEGDKHGYKWGYSNGRSTLSRPWFFVVALVFLFAGMGFGMSFDYFVSCVPIAEGEVKTCTVQEEL